MPEPRPAPFVFRPLTAADVAAMGNWRYPPPYDLYDGDPDADPAAFLAGESLVLAAERRDEPGELAAFVSFGPDGRVPGGEAAGVYAEPLVDLGLGLRPDLTGRGLGLDLVQAALAEGRRRYPGAGFRLTVAAANLRARRVYERAGFVTGERFTSPVAGRAVEFLLMRLRDNGG